MPETNSYRWKTSAAVDVDAFLLTNRRWLLFAYVKDERLASLETNALYWKNLAAEFTGGEVMGIARALKTEKSSEPLAPLALEGSLPEEVWAREAWLRYRLETAKVLNPGLFLDQAENRSRLITLVQHFIARSKGEFGEDDGVLNLFSFTGSFSIAAICGGARSTTSVDVSARYLAWEKENFAANFGGHDQVAHRLICDDARDFLRRAVKRGARYRWIIIDPPTFSRGKGKPFKIQEDLRPMLEDAASCLTKGGAIFVSANDARWEPRAFQVAMEKFARAHSLLFEPGGVSPGFTAAHPLKSAWFFAGV